MKQNKDQGFPWWSKGKSLEKWKVAKTPYSNAGDLGFIPGQGTRSHVLQLIVCMPQLKILHRAKNTLPTKNTLPRKAFLQNLRTENEFSKQEKLKKFMTTRLIMPKISF